jgi:hypothetical protein
MVKVPTSAGSTGMIRPIGDHVDQHRDA